MKENQPSCPAMIPNPEKPTTAPHCDLGPPPLCGQHIDIGPRKYVTGESGCAEMCDMFCRSMGRGHFHIRPCEAPQASSCTHSAREGRRHETVRYGPDENVPKDELTHDAHWATAGWKDPCSDLERQVREAWRWCAFYNFGGWIGGGVKVG